MGKYQILQGNKKGRGPVLGLFMLVFFCVAGISGPVYAETDDMSAPSSPFMALEEQWLTPEVFVEGISDGTDAEDSSSPALPTDPMMQVGAGPELDLPSAPELEADEVVEAPEEELPTVTPTLMPDMWAWKGVNDLPQTPANDIALDFTDDATHWKKLEDVQGSLDDFYAVDLKKGQGAVSRIRFSLLPRPDMQAVFEKKISKPKIPPRVAKTVVKKPTPAKKVCKAFSKARKRQLDAIESDRRTLMELRKAMNDLGLEKKLSFMADGARTVPKSDDVNGGEAVKSIQ